MQLVLEPEIVPERTCCEADHPYAFVGSLDLRQENVVETH